MAKSVYNPSDGADIVDRNVGGQLFTVKVGDSAVVPDAVAEELCSVYGFLEVKDVAEKIVEVKEEAPVKKAKRSR